MKPNARPSLAVCVAASIGLVACEGSELVRPIDKSATHDVADGSDGDGSEVTGTGLDFWFLTANGLKGAELDQVALGIADEILDYRLTPDFQVDIRVAARTAQAGSQARLLVDNTAVAVVDLVEQDGVLSATFSAVTLPVRAAGVPVRVETTDTAGLPIAREKTVTVAHTGCTVDAVITENALQCAATTYDPIGGLTVGVDVTLVDGPCDLAALQVLFGADTTTVGPIAFSDTKLAHFDVVLAPGTGAAPPALSGELRITATATVAADPLTGGAIELTSMVDTDVPTVDLVAPSEGNATITLDSDLGGDPTDGLQFAVEFSSNIAETARAVLTLDGVEVGAMDIAPQGALTFSFPAVTLTQNGPVVFAVTVTDACGNVGSATATVLVLSAAGQIGIVAPTNASVLLARDDGNAATANVFDGTFDVLTTGAQVGATIGIWCAAAASIDPLDLVQVGTRTIATGGVSPNGRYQIDVAIDVGALGQEVRCVARIDLPASAESAPTGLTIALPAPTLVVTAPADAICITATNIAVAGTATGLDGEPVLVDFGTGTPTALSAVAAGAWGGTVNLAVTAPDGTYALGFDATDALGNIVSDTSGPIGVSVVLDRSQPVLAVVAPASAIDASVTPDESGTQTGFQTTARATVTDAHAEGASACLAVNGGTPTCVDVAADGTAAWPLVTLETGPNTLTYTVTDTCGNASAEVTRLVTLTQTTAIAIVTPADGTTLRAADDGDPATARIFEGDVVVDSDDAAVGAAIDIACRTNAAGALFVEVGSFVVVAVAADGRYTVPVAIDTASLGTDVVCRATVDLPFAGVSATVGLRIGLPVPTIGITSPTIGSCATAATLNVTGAATGLDGQSLSGVLGTGSAAGTVAAGAYALTIPVPSGADGPTTLTVSGVDTFGNTADASVAMLVDRTAPTLTYDGPASPLDPSAVPDADPVAPGYQTTVSATLVDLVALGGEVCLAVNGGSMTCLEIGDTSGAVAFPNVTLQAGDNTLAFAMTDGCGNAGLASTETVSLVASTPVVAITTPASDIVTAAATVGLTATVNLGGAPLTGATVTLSANGAPVALTPTDNGDGTYTFASVPLTAGAATAFVISATPGTGGGTGASSARTVTQKNVLPAIVITAPGGGPVNLATPTCAVGQVDCVMTVPATTTNAEDGSVTSLAVVCDGAASSYAGVVSAGATSFAGVVLPDSTTCLLTASVTDAAAQTASSGTVTVDVDRTAPVLDITSPSGPLQNTNDLTPGTAGIQAPLLVDVAGLEAGQTLDVVLTWTDAGGPQTKAYSAVVTGTDGVVAMEEFAGAGWVTWPEGLITVTASAEDLAANPGTDVLSVPVSSTGDVRITSPVAVADSCAGTCATGVCNGGACWRTWGIADSRQVVAAPAGITTTSQNIRVCSDEPSLAAAGAAVCASAPSATGAYRQVLIGNTTGALTVLDVSAVLPAGFQRLVVEVMPIAGGGWLSSLGTVNAAERLRRIHVDVSAPAVSGLGSPSDTLAPIGTLNAAEQVSSPRVYQIAFTPSEDARAEVFVQGASVLVQDVVATPSPTTVQVTLPEGTPQVWVVLTDSVGNRSATSPATGALTYQPTVDVTPPTLSFSRPNVSPLHSGDNLDVVLTSNAEGRTATVRDAGVDVASAAITSGAATFADATFHILTDGTHTLTATVSDAAGNPVTVATTPASVVVDAVPPVGTITDPVELDTFTDADDADPASGFQVSVTFTTSGATSWRLLTADGCDATWSGCDAPVQQSTGAVTNPGGAEPPQLVTVDLEAALTFKKIILETTDAGGNTATTDVDVSFAVSACALAFTNLPSSAWYNMSVCPGGTPCASTSVAIDVQLTGACALTELRLLNGGATVGTIPDPAGTETFLLTVADAAHLTLEAKGFAGASEAASTGVRVRDADFTPPSVQFVSQVVNGFTTTAEGANTTYNVATDLLPSTAGMQLHAAVRVTDTNANGGRIESISAAGTSGTTALSPSNISLPSALAGASPITENLLDLTLADNDTYTVTVTGSDAAGNADTSSYIAKVDVTAPAEVPISSIAMQQRRPRANQFRWTTVGDDGNTNGAVARYEIRYSFQPIDASTWDAACLGSGVWGSNALPAPVPAGTVQGSLVGAPDTRPITDPCKLPVFFEANEAPTEAAMYFAIRAVDDAGNWSPLGSLSARAVTNAETWMRLTRIRFDNTGGTLGIDPNFLTVRGAIVGDINGDTRPDWAVGSANSGGACVMLGHSYPVDGETISTPTGTNHTCITNTQATALIANATQVGTTIEPLGDINGDARADFAITGKVASGSPHEGFALIYLGQAITAGNPNGMPNLTAPNIIVRGIDALNVAFAGVCGAGNFDGAGPADFAIGEPFSNRINVFPGNASWTSDGTNLTINLDTAGAVADNGGMTINFSGPATAGFGARCGSAGDLLPAPVDLKDDLLVNQTGSDNGRVFVFPGRTWTAGDTSTVTQNPAGTPEDLRSLRLRQENDGPQAGFGSGFQGQADLTGDGIPDVLVVVRGRSFDNAAGANHDGKAIHIFDGAKLAAGVGGDVRVDIGANPKVGESWTGLNGWVLYSSVFGDIRSVRAVGDFNQQNFAGRPTLDLAIANIAGDTVQMRMNHPRSGVNELAQFSIIDGLFDNFYNDAANGVGTWIDASGDLTGDSQPDFIVGSQKGDVLIIR